VTAVVCEGECYHASLCLHGPRQHPARQGCSLLRDAQDNFSLLAIRALEACHRAGVEVVMMSGRRKAQVYEDARLIGQPAYIYEMGCGLVNGPEEEFLAVASTRPPTGRCTSRSGSGGRPRYCSRPRWPVGCVNTIGLSRARSPSSPDGELIDGSCVE
jgi:hypothetical protein